MVEDHAELPAVLLEFGLTQRQAGEAGHVGDVDIDGHQAWKCRWRQ
jgi:hypothetical protein